MKIVEIFYSLQGEGFLAGVPSMFVRLAGCPLRCKWCDTKYAWDERSGKDYSIEDVCEEIQKWKSKYVVITGGEPMINRDLPELVQKLKSLGKHITIETAGIAFVPSLACDLMSISPKLSNAESTPEATILRKLIDNYKYQLKFVVESEGDLAEIHQTIKNIGNVDCDKVMLMPQAATREELLGKSPMTAEMCRQTGFAFCQRLHVLLWDNKRGV
ncbi:MAG: 7-carboxy-7-deazaguanine synthase QueE [Sedimentisphaerales bacterium]|nr:7-carboxy-7-deazaguanine synthase QueE [Sedimentisphaerales bacterium]